MAPNESTTRDGKKSENQFWENSSSGQQSRQLRGQIHIILAQNMIRSWLLAENFNQLSLLIELYVENMFKLAELPTKQLITIMYVTSNELSV